MVTSANIDISTLADASWFPQVVCLAMRSYKLEFRIDDEK